VSGSKPKGVLFQPFDDDGVCFPDRLRCKLSQIIDYQLITDVEGLSRHRLDGFLRETRLWLGTWGMPRLDEAMLNAMPELEAVFYAAGSVESFATQAMWNRGVRVSSAIALNSQPVAQFTLAHILFSLKLGWHHVSRLRQARQWRRMPDVPGVAGSRVGVVSLGTVAQQLIELLEPFNLDIVVYDIHHDENLAARHRLRYVRLDELFATSQVVTLHTPLLPQTRGMIGGDLLRAMPPNATLINTARGGVIDQPAMIEVLQARPDLMALLDVVDPEPPDADSPLWTLPNVVLTPHVAGAFGRERRRLGEFAIAELRRYLRGESLLGEVRRPTETSGVSLVGST
jgi:phosphoglycerate dehydrogenase-like enzyme